MKNIFPSFQFCHVAYRPINSGAVQLDSKNIDSTLGNFQFEIHRLKILNFFPFLFSADNEFVFINFYADWCRFSNMLAPIWDEAAEKAEKEFPEKGKVVFAKVDCDKHSKFSFKLQFFYLISFFNVSFYFFR